MTFAQPSPQRAGQGLICGHIAQFQQSDWSVEERSHETVELKWHDHFFGVQRETKRDIAKPAKWNNKLVFRGGLKPAGKPYPPPHYEYVYTSNGEYIIADMGDIKELTDKEYNQHFRKLLDKYAPTIVKRSQRKAVDLLETQIYAVVKFKLRKD